MHLTAKTVGIGVGLLGLIAAVLIFGFFMANRMLHDSAAMGGRTWEAYACVGFAIAMAAVILIFGGKLLRSGRL